MTTKQNTPNDKTEVSIDKLLDDYSIRSFTDFMNHEYPPLEWLVDGLIQKGGFSILAAKPKAGKSTLARQLAACVVNGNSFLERKVQKGKVLFISLEEPGNEIQDHFKKLQVQNVEALFIYVGRLPINQFDWLKSFILMHKPDLIIIDTLFKFVSIKDVNDYAATIQGTNPILELARNHSVHIMCLHHARKGEHVGADSMLGSTGFRANVDSTIMLTRDKNGQTIETDQRYGTPIESSALIFDPDSKTMRLGVSHELKKQLSISDAITDYIKQSPGSGRQQIAKGVTGRTQEIYQVLDELVLNKKLAESGSGSKGDPKTYSIPEFLP